jgi:CubicO group peptidase (beta-lactamase class C family)
MASPRRILPFAFAILVGLAPLVGASAQSAPAPITVTPAYEARIDSLLAPWVLPGSPGAAVAVVVDGELVFSRGYGLANLEYDIPITPGSIFHIASISKQFTTFAIALLAQGGGLSLDDEVRMHLPEVPDFGVPITIRHLIHHTSGIRDQWELLAMAGWRLDDVITRDHIMGLIRHQRELNFVPGEEYLYSNMGYTLLAEIVERVSGQPFPEFAEQRIFRPLGMTSTHFHDDHRRIVPNRAYSYSPLPGGGFRHAPLNYANVGATSLFTTVEDLARWDRNFRAATVGGVDVMRMMETRGVLNDGQELPYAFALIHGEHRGVRTLGHGGADAGYRTNYLRFPDHGLSVIVFSNLASLNAGRVAQQVGEVFLADRMVPDRMRIAASASPRPARSIRLSARELAPLAGSYADPDSDQVRRIELREGRLVLMAAQEAPLVPVAPTRFRLESAPVGIEFIFEAPRGGPATALVELVAGEAPTRFESVEPPAPAELARFAGTYYSEELGTSYTLGVEDGGLVARHRRHEPIPLIATLPDRFAGSAWWFRQLRMERGEDGEITGFRVSGGRVRNLWFQRVD